MKEVCIVPQSELKDRDPKIIDCIIGKRRRPAVRKFEEYPLFQMYPDWDAYHEALEEERVEAKREGREAHPAAVKPGQMYVHWREREAAAREGREPKPTLRKVREGKPGLPWSEGPSVADVHREYKTKEA